ncbi:LANO_0D01024g1_1 [Lachancea nothofagi CBS 11611]|uniref:Exocyst complex component SEC15 n=1 Tax=Lachancea nothofagi CBS 11611 TaxID=1266666 RepID=A0A1G4JD56_9SACH|nr:LANO_0D01024g1_1 [Lachancea nothofagi CBS 11611]
MEADAQNQVSEELQKVLLSTDLSLLKCSFDDRDRHDGSTAEQKYEEELDLDEHTFNKWTPLLRTAIENEALPVVVDELYNSIEGNFENLENQILQDSQLTDNLTVSVNQISSIKEIIEQSLLRETEDLRVQLAQTTNDVITRKQNYINNKKTSTKISESIILIRKILQILELSNKCQDLIKDGSYFKALQSLGGLEKIYVQDFKNYNFDFLKTIYASIPVLKSKIKDESINMVKSSFNSNLEKKLVTVGHKYFDFYKGTLLSDWINSKNDMKLGSYKFNSPVEISLRHSEKMGSMNAATIFPLDEFYDSILIFQNLKEVDYLCNEFRKEYNFRISKVVYPLDLKASSSSNTVDQRTKVAASFGDKFSIDQLKEYLLRILGFVIYDKHLNKSTEYILSYNSMSTSEDFWDTFITRFSPFLEHFVAMKGDSEDCLIELKDFLGIYIAILENLNVNVDQIYKVQVLLFKKYAALLFQVFKTEFSTLLADDDFMPLTINDEGLYDKVLKICWLKDDELERPRTSEGNTGEPFFATLPFSPLYPMSCTLAKKTYNKLIVFLSEFYRYDLGELSNVIVHTIDDIFGKVVNDKIGSKLDTTSREEIAQILINLDYFIVAVKEFSKILSRENITHNPDVELALRSVKLLSDSRSNSETKLIELIDSKISDLMEFVEFEWTSARVDSEPSFSIKDIAQFLEMMFTSTLVNLPDSVKTLLVFREFDALTRRFLDVLLHYSPSAITPQSVLSFELNMNFLEGIISKLFPDDENLPPTPTSPDLGAIHFPENPRSSNLIDNTIRSLHSTFTDLKQHIQFLKSPDINEYKDPSIRMRKYPRIKPEVAQMLHNKMVPPTSAGTDSPNSSSVDQSFADSISSHKRIAKFFNRA